MIAGWDIFPPHFPLVPPPPANISYIRCLLLYTLFQLWLSGSLCSDFFQHCLKPVWLSQAPWIILDLWTASIGFLGKTWSKTQDPSLWELSRMWRDFQLKYIWFKMFLALINYKLWRRGSCQRVNVNLTWRIWCIASKRSFIPNVAGLVNYTLSVMNYYAFKNISLSKMLCRWNNKLSWWF